MDFAVGLGWVVYMITSLLGQATGQYLQVFVRLRFTSIGGRIQDSIFSSCLSDCHIVTLPMKKKKREFTYKKGDGNCSGNLQTEHKSGSSLLLTLSEIVQKRKKLYSDVVSHNHRKTLTYSPLTYDS